MECLAANENAHMVAYLESVMNVAFHFNAEESTVSKLDGLQTRPHLAPLVRPHSANISCASENVVVRAQLVKRDAAAVHRERAATERSVWSITIRSNFNDE